MTPEQIAVFFDVATWSNALSGVVTGLLVGAFAIYPVARAMDSRPPIYKPRVGFLLFVVLMVILLGPFYISQTLAEAATEAGSWPRVLGRALMALVYITSAAGGWALRFHLAGRRPDLLERIENGDNGGTRKEEP